ncbi:MAG: ICE-like protease, partial [Spirochaetae bacterium HGW-Spirochaetae-6]
MRPMKILWILLLIMLSQGAFAREALKRYALLVGNNYGGRERVTLKYSLTDARAMGKVLQELGGVEKEDLYLLAEPSKKKIERVLAEMKERVAGAREQYERIELLFYYSGHSDIQGLLIGQENLDYAFIRKAIKAIPADLKVAVLDSCASGAITRLKGGVKRPPFMVDSSMRMKGYAFITSSSHDEASQESDRIKGSFFTYYFLSGLRGAADLSQDGRVTLNEVYQYAFH